MIKVYGIPNCDVVKKSTDWFKGKKIAFQFHNFKTEELTRAKLSEWIDKAGLDVVVNKRSTTWRNLSEKMKLNMEDKNKAIDILTVETSIIKRPVIESEKGLVIGFNEAEYSNKFLS